MEVILRSHSVKLAMSLGRFFKIIESLYLIAVIFVPSTSYSTASIVSLIANSFEAESVIALIVSNFFPLCKSFFLTSQRKLILFS